MSLEDQPGAQALQSRCYTIRIWRSAVPHRGWHQNIHSVWRDHDHRVSQTILKFPATTHQECCGPPAHVPHVLQAYHQYQKVAQTQSAGSSQPAVASSASSTTWSSCTHTRTHGHRHRPRRYDQQRLPMTTTSSPGKSSPQSIDQRSYQPEHPHPLSVLDGRNS